MTNKPDKSEIDITFFVPCFNEEENIVNTLNAIYAAASATSLSYEILVIDDCSRDGTVALVEEYQHLHANIPIILKRNAVNRGLGHNYIDGAFIGQGTYYMLVNGDNAEPEEALSAILSKVGQADMVIPYFGANDKRLPWRRLLSRFFTALVNTASGFSIKYYNGPVVHKRYNVMRWHPDTHGFAYQAETITRLLEECATYIEIEIANKDRQYGMTKAFCIQNILSISHSLLQIFLRRLRHVLFYRRKKAGS